MNETKSAKMGVFTPQAEVLCVECEYKFFVEHPQLQRSYDRRWDKLQKTDLKAMIPLPDEQALTTVCDVCRCECWNRFDVAICQKVMLAYGDISWSDDDCNATPNMAQTGGMCVASTFSIEDDNEVQQRVIAVCDDGGSIMVGEYVRTDEPKNEGIEWNEPTRFETLKFPYLQDEETGDKVYTNIDQTCSLAAQLIIQWVKNPPSAEEIQRVKEEE